MTEFILCPNCGAENEFENNFCNSCGANLTEEPIDTSKTEPITSPTPSVTPQSPAETTTQVQQPSKPRSTRWTAWVIIGLVFGIITMFILSWVTLFSLLWMPYLYLGIAVVGFIFSAISLKDNIGIGILNIVMNSIGAVVQVIWIVILIILEIFIEIIST